MAMTAGEGDWHEEHVGRAIGMRSMCMLPHKSASSFKELMRMEHQHIADK